MNSYAKPIIKARQFALPHLREQAVEKLCEGKMKKISGFFLCSLQMLSINHKGTICSYLILMNIFELFPNILVKVIFSHMSNILLKHYA